MNILLGLPAAVAILMSSSGDGCPRLICALAIERRTSVNWNLCGHPETTHLSAGLTLGFFGSPEKLSPRSPEVAVDEEVAHPEYPVAQVHSYPVLL